MLFNMFGGEYGEGQRKHILLPLAPEYIGYADAGIDSDLFRAVQPDISFTDAHEFKYRVDFEAVEVTPVTCAICVSRPSNPTGSGISDVELGGHEEIARERDIPLMVDGACGWPSPS